MSGMYWGAGALSLLGALGRLDRSKVIAWVLSCYDASVGAFRPAPRHDAHLLSTLSALQLLALYDGLGELGEERRAALVAGIAAMQLPDGSFAGDRWGEVDTRFSYVALNSLWLLDALDAVDVPKAAAWVRSCESFDGGYGVCPGAESHAGQAFVAVAALAIAHGWEQRKGRGFGEAETERREQRGEAEGKARAGRGVDAPGEGAAERGGAGTADEGSTGDRGAESSGVRAPSTRYSPLPAAEFLPPASRDTLSWWLAERQTLSGGLNGRPEKLQDVCYSWWCLTSLATLARLHWIDRDALEAYILECQDEVGGGISDRPEDAVDVYHTYFGIAALALMRRRDLPKIDPVLALPVEVVRRIRKSRGEEES